MHKIHSVAGFGDGQDDSVIDKTLSSFYDGAEQHEQSETHAYGYRGQILPVLFHYGGSRRAGAVVVGAAECDGIQNSQQRYAYGEYLVPAPIQVRPDEMPQDEIARKAGYIVESRVGIPPALSENVTAQDRTEAVEYAGKQPYAEKEEFLIAAESVQPGGDDRHYEV